MLGIEVRRKHRRLGIAGEEQRHYNEDCSHSPWREICATSPHLQGGWAWSGRLSGGPVEEGVGMPRAPFGYPIMPTPQMTEILVWPTIIH